MSDVTVGQGGGFNLPDRDALGKLLKRPDLFLAIGYDAFHLTRAEGVSIPDGVPLFSGCRDGASAEALLAERGMKPEPRRILDPAGPVSLTIWRNGRRDL